MKEEILKKIRSFECHGFHSKGESGNQVYGDCPFCGKEGKFYLNPEKLLWDCKVCQRKGGYNGFLEEICKRNEGDLSPKLLEKLSADRNLPLSVFEGTGIGWNGEEYTIPVRDAEGRVQDVRKYRLKSKIMGTTGASVGLIGLDELAKSESDTVFICEGEWDYFAFRWLLRKLGRVESAVGVPGATTFKQEWVKYFSGKKVRVLYDNDTAGEQGELVVRKRLSGFVRDLQYIHWPTQLPDGFDIRDIIIRDAVKGSKPRGSLKTILSLLRPESRMKQDPTDPKNSVEPENKEYPEATLEQVHEAYSRWLKLRSTDVIDVMLASHLSASPFFKGEPTWLFLVAPPGGSKTEILNGLIKCPDAYMTSSITSKTLMSGQNSKSDGDLSLLPHLQNKSLLIKDFTSLLAKRSDEKDEIFGDLRDAYDGRCGKVFGNGVRRDYKVRFNIIAGVTTDIYVATAHYKSMGERFLNFNLGDNLDHHCEIDICEKAIGNMESEEAMRENIAETVAGFVQAIHRKIEKMEGRYPKIPPEMVRKLISLARWGARARATIHRDNFDHDNILGKPSAEVATRLSKQLAGLLVRLAIVRGHDVVTDDDYRLIVKIMHDTVPQRFNDLFRTMYRLCPTKNDSISTVRLIEEVRYPNSTVNRLLKDMVMLDIVTRIGAANSREWSISEYMLNLIIESDVYKRS